MSEYINPQNIQNIIRNINWIDSFQDKLNTVSKGQIYEAAQSGIFKDKNDTELFNKFREVFGNRNIYKRFAIYMKECELLADKNDASKPSHSFLISNYEDEILGKDAVSRAAYVRNLYSDSAYMAFSRVGAVKTAVYHPSFISACEEVAEGKSEFCIIPVYNSLDGDLLSLVKLADRYDLKIVKICRIQSSDADTVTNYALMSRSIRLLNDKYNYFELAVNLQKSNIICDLLEAFEIFETSIDRMSYLPTGYSSEYMRLKIVLNISSCDPISLLRYMYITMPDFTPIGLYDIID